MVQGNRQNQTTRINASTVGSGSGSVQVSNNRAQQWADIAKEWAISDKLVQQTDYSSKYYAQQSKASADSSQEYFEESKLYSDNAIENINTLSENFTKLSSEKSEALLSEYTTYSDNITSAHQTAVSEITTAQSTAETAITADKTAALSDIAAAKSTAETTITSMQTQAVEAVETAKDEALEEIEASVPDYTGGDGIKIENEVISARLSEESDNALALKDDGLYVGETDTSNLVTLNTAQTISAAKNFGPYLTLSSNQSGANQYSTLKGSAYVNHFDTKYKDSQCWAFNTDPRYSAGTYSGEYGPQLGRYVPYLREGNITAGDNVTITRTTSGGTITGIKIDSNVPLNGVIYEEI